VDVTLLLRAYIVGGWRRLHSEALCNLYTTPNIIKMIKSGMIWVGHVACIGEVRNGYNISVGKPERKRPLGSHRYGQEDNIRMDLREMR
jgi:hypothetical protein